MIVRAAVGGVSSILLRQAKQGKEVISDSLVLTRQEEEKETTMRRISLPGPPSFVPKDFSRSPLGSAIRKGSIFDRVGPGGEETSGKSRKLSVVWSKTTPGANLSTGIIDSQWIAPNLIIKQKEIAAQFDGENLPQEGTSYNDR